MPNPEEIVAAVVGRARLDPQVMGANLGMAVKRAVPSANLKEYGGPRLYMANCNSGIVCSLKTAL